MDVLDHDLDVVDDPGRVRHGQRGAGRVLGLLANLQEEHRPV
jgi:hypothetical protein